jgi:hypothetical protein
LGGGSWSRNASSPLTGEHLWPAWLRGEEDVCDRRPPLNMS